MEYPETIFVRTDYVPLINREILTPNKIYKAVASEYYEGAFDIIDDKNRKTLINPRHCSFLQNHPWEIVDKFEVLVAKASGEI